MLLPGPEAMQLATYTGWRLQGVWGGLTAGALFVLPGAAVILVLALVYAQFGEVPLVQSAFVGIKAAVIVIVLQALLKVAQKALRTSGAWVVASVAFIALFLFNVAFPIIIAFAALWGAWVLSEPATEEIKAPAGARLSPLPVIALWGSIWAAPIVALALLDRDFLLQIALFFSWLAVVTFGGAYAVLAYMTQTVVADFGWISTAQMIDALGLAETTPGPLILVTQFVAMLAGFLEGGLLLSLTAGIVALWVTFVPCFLWIFLAAPYLEAISARPRVAAALSGITAAVVGGILNLALWFAIHVLFGEVTSSPGVAVPIPVIASFDAVAALLTCTAALLMVGLKRGIAETLGILAVVGVALSFF